MATVPAGCILVVSGYLGQKDYKHYETNFFYIVSSLGVAGSFYHNLLLNQTHDTTIYYASLLIWISPYLFLGIVGVMKWNPAMDKMRLFIDWFANYAITIAVYKFLIDGYGNICHYAELFV